MPSGYITISWYHVEHVSEPFILTISYLLAGLLWWLSSNQPTCNTGDTRSILGGGNGNSLQDSSLENPWTEESGELQSMRSRRIRHNWAHRRIGLLQSKMKATSSTSGKFQLLLTAVFRQGLNTARMWPVWSIIWLTLFHSENSLTC